MIILKGYSNMGGPHYRSAMSLHDFEIDNVFLEIPSGGRLTRFCYVLDWLLYNSLKR